MLGPNPNPLRGSGGIPRSGRIALWTPGGPNVALNPGLSQWAQDGNLIPNSNLGNGAGWTYGGSPAITTGLSDPRGGTLAYRIAMTIPASEICRFFVSPSPGSWVFHAYIRSTSGSQYVYSRFYDGSVVTVPGTESVINISEAWSELTIIGSPANTASMNVQLRPSTGSGSTSDARTIEIAFPSIAPGTTTVAYQATAAKQIVYDPTSGLSLTLGSGATADNADPQPRITNNKVTSLAFDGTDDFATATMGLSGDWTLMFLIYPDDNTSRGILANGVTTPTVSLDANGKVAYAGGSTVTSTAAVAQDAWSLVGIVKSGATITHYLNGMPNGSGESATGNAFADLKFGTDGSSFFDGACEVISPFTRALTAGEMWRSYQAIKAKSAVRGVSIG